MTLVLFTCESQHNKSNFCFFGSKGEILSLFLVHPVGAFLSRKKQSVHLNTSWRREITIIVPSVSRHKGANDRGKNHLSWPACVPFFPLFGNLNAHLKRKLRRPGKEAWVFMLQFWKKCRWLFFSKGQNIEIVLGNLLKVWNSCF